MKSWHVLLVSGIMASAPIGSAFAAAITPAKDAASKGTAIFRIAGVLVKKEIKKGKKSKEKRLVPAFVKIKVKPGDVIRTDAHSRADVHLGDGILIRIKENSVLRITQFKTRKKAERVQLKVLGGKILLKISKRLGLDRRISVRTPTAVAAVRGTIFVVDATKPSETDIKVLEGTVHASAVNSATGKEEAGGRDVEAGKEIEAVQGQTLSQPHEMLAQETAEETNWAQEAEMEAVEEPGNEDENEEAGEVEESEAPELVEPAEQGDNELPEIEESDSTDTNQEE